MTFKPMGPSCPGGPGIPTPASPLTPLGPCGPLIPWRINVKEAFKDAHIIVEMKWMAVLVVLPLK